MGFYETKDMGKIWVLYYPAWASKNAIKIV